MSHERKPSSSSTSTAAKVSSTPFPREGPISVGPSLSIASKTLKSAASHVISLPASPPLSPTGTGGAFSNDSAVFARQTYRGKGTSLRDRAPPSLITKPSNTSSESRNMVKFGLGLAPGEPSFFPKQHGGEVVMRPASATPFSPTSCHPSSSALSSTFNAPRSRRSSAPSGRVNDGERCEILHAATYARTPETLGSKHVWFGNGDAELFEAFTPYGEKYGVHLADFFFDHDGCMVFAESPKDPVLQHSDIMAGSMIECVFLMGVTYRTRPAKIAHRDDMKTVDFGDRVTVAQACTGWVHDGVGWLPLTHEGKALFELCANNTESVKNGFATHRMPVMVWCSDQPDLPPPSGDVVPDTLAGA